MAAPGGNSGFKNLRAMFEQAGSSSPASPATETFKPKPIGRVRTNFVAIEGQNGQVGLKKLDELGNPTSITPTPPGTPGRMPTTPGLPEKKEEQLFNKLEKEAEKVTKEEAPVTPAPAPVVEKKVEKVEEPPKAELKKPEPEKKKEEVAPAPAPAPEPEKKKEEPVPAPAPAAPKKEEAPKKIENKKKEKKPENLKVDSKPPARQPSPVTPTEIKKEEATPKATPSKQANAKTNKKPVEKKPAKKEEPKPEPIKKKQEKAPAKVEAAPKPAPVVEKKKVETPKEEKKEPLLASPIDLPEKPVQLEETSKPEEEVKPQVPVEIVPPTPVTAEPSEPVKAAPPPAKKDRSPSKERRKKEVKRPKSSAAMTRPKSSAATSRPAPSWGPPPKQPKTPSRSSTFNMNDSRTPISAKRPSTSFADRRSDFQKGGHTPAHEQFVKPAPRPVTIPIEPKNPSAYAPTASFAQKMHGPISPTALTHAKDRAFPISPGRPKTPTQQLHLTTKQPRSAKSAATSPTKGTDLRFPDTRDKMTSSRNSMTSDHSAQFNRRSMDAGFLARLSRPTAASANKVVDKKQIPSISPRRSGEQRRRKVRKDGTSTTDDDDHSHRAELLSSHGSEDMHDHLPDTHSVMSEEHPAPIQEQATEETA